MKGPPMEVPRCANGVDSHPLFPQFDHHSPKQAVNAERPPTPPRGRPSSPQSFFD